MEGETAGSYPVCRPVGDRHITIELGASINPETSVLVRRTKALLESLRPAGLRETTPTYSSLLIRYDPLQTDYVALASVGLEAAEAAARLRPDSWTGPAEGPTAKAHGQAAGASGPAAGAPGSVAEAVGTATDAVRVPVVYGGKHGPDLEDVARQAGLEPREVASRHAAGLYRVYLLGFAPGFAYLGGLDPTLATPRRQTPRPRVPEGSVGIAGEQTGVYPKALPGGWQLIGRTPLQLWDPDAGEPALLGPGRAVRFVDAGPGAKGWARAVRMAAAEERRLGRGRAKGGLAGREKAGEGAVGNAGVADSSAATAEGAGRGLAEIPLAEVLTAGPFETIQDGGRWGYSAQGLPESGAMDWPALAEANSAVGNGSAAAAVEVTYGGLRLRLLAGVTFAVSPGARASLDGRPVAPGRGLSARPGATLAFAPGARPRCYLAFGGGGLSCPVVLGSRSTYTPADLGGLEGRPLRRGDILCGFAGPQTQPEARSEAEHGGGISRGVAPENPVERASPARMRIVRAVPGPQDGLFGAGVVDLFFDRSWRVLPSSDRRACLLDGEALEAPAGGGVSDGSPAGSVQVLPSGQPLVLLPDHQTTGGYAKIATVVGPDLPLLARAWPESLVRFSRVTVEQARRIWLEMPRSRAESWPGNGSPETGRRVWLLSLEGRRHLVSVDPSPPR